jgi:hypothetical protein
MYGVQSRWSRVIVRRVAASLALGFAFDGGYASAGPVTGEFVDIAGDTFTHDIAVNERTV